MFVWLSSLSLCAPFHRSLSLFHAFCHLSSALATRLRKDRSPQSSPHPHHAHPHRWFLFSCNYFRFAKWSTPWDTSTPTRTHRGGGSTPRFHIPPNTLTPHTCMKLFSFLTRPYTHTLTIITPTQVVHFHLQLLSVRQANLQCWVRVRLHGHTGGGESTPRFHTPPNTLTPHTCMKLFSFLTRP